MRGYNVPPWPPGYGWRRAGEGVPPSEMRVSDAERQVIADALSRHYADGRLDRSEFDDRMGKALAAKTRGDLAGLLRDLPPLEAAEPERPPSRRHRPRAALLLVAGALFFAISSAWSLPGWAWRGWIWRPHLGFLFFVLMSLYLFTRRARRGWRYSARFRDPTG